jgi:hypothetical protein
MLFSVTRLRWLSDNRDHSVGGDPSHLRGYLPATAE